MKHVKSALRSLSFTDMTRLAEEVWILFVTNAGSLGLAQALAEFAEDAPEKEVSTR